MSRRRARGRSIPPEADRGDDGEHSISSLAGDDRSEPAWRGLCGTDGYKRVHFLWKRISNQAQSAKPSA